MSLQKEVLKKGYDIIGDIHGHADELESLLTKLGYEKDDDGIYCDPTGLRTLVFVGDLVDRGPKIREVLQIVKPLVDKKRALCIMGNHEFNAVNFMAKKVTGDFHRSHTITNIIQQFNTLKAFHNREDEHREYLEWFKTLPVYLDLPDFRAIHACWDDTIKRLIPNGTMSENEWYHARQVGSQFYNILYKVLKGEEMDLPEGYFFHDKDGTKRTRCRTKWWKNSHNLPINDYIEANVTLGLSDNVLVEKGSHEYPFYEKPVFFGHYWLKGEPELQAKNVCCLDYSVAKGGALVAYRLNCGEKELFKDRFVRVETE